MAVTITNHVPYEYLTVVNYYMEKGLWATGVLISA